LLAFGARVAKSGADSFLNERSFEFGHCRDDWKHQPSRWDAWIEIVTQAYESKANRTVIINSCRSVIRATETSTTGRSEFPAEIPHVVIGLMATLAQRFGCGTRAVYANH